MNYVKVKILPRPHNIEFKCVGRLIFDINYVEYTKFESKRWLNSKEQFYRENGPASIWNNGSQFWYRYGKLHREDGPAGIWNNGEEQSWRLNDIKYSKENFKKAMRRRHELRKRKNLTKTT